MKHVFFFMNSVICFGGMQCNNATRTLLIGKKIFATAKFRVMEGPYLAPQNFLEVRRSSLSRKLTSNKYLKGISIAKIPPRTSFHLDKGIDVKHCFCLGSVRSSLLGSNSKMLHLIQRFSAVREQRYFHCTPGPYYR